MASPTVVPRGETVVPCPAPQVAGQQEFAPHEKRFIERYVSTEDIKAAAETARIRLSEAKRLLKEQRIQNEISARTRATDDVVAKHIATARLLTIDAVDASIIEVLQAPMVIKGVPAARVSAAKLAYGRLSVPIEPPERRSANPQAEFNVYRATREITSTCVTRTITEDVIEQKSERQIVEICDPQPKPAEPQIPDEIVVYLDQEIKDY